MKKVLIFLFVMLAIMPVFAVDIDASFGVSSTIAIDEKPEFEGIGLYVQAFKNNWTSDFVLGGKAEVKYSIKNQEVTGLYLDVIAGYAKAFDTQEEVSYLLRGAIGIGADIHLVDGNVKANVGAIGEVGGEIKIDNEKTFYFFPTFTGRYNFIRDTEAPACTVEFGIATKAPEV